MSRSYSLRKVHDPLSGKAIYNARCEGYQGTTLSETQYTNADGAATFTTLSDTDPVDIKIAYGHTCYWIRDIFGSTSGTIIVINFIIDGGGVVISAGQKGHVVVPFNGTILSSTILADQSGSAVVDIWKDTYANFPPADADSITASAPPTLSSATKAQDTTLTGWTTAITTGDVLAFNVDSCSTCTRLTISLKVKKI